MSEFEFRVAEMKDVAVLWDLLSLHEGYGKKLCSKSKREFVEATVVKNGLFEIDVFKENLKEKELIRQKLRKFVLVERKGQIIGLLGLCPHAIVSETQERKVRKVFLYSTSEMIILPKFRGKIGKGAIDALKNISMGEFALLTKCKVVHVPTKKKANSHENNARRKKVPYSQRKNKPK